MEKLGQLRARAEADRTLGPHRRRHPAEPVGAGLPRRAAAARVVPRRAVHPDAVRARQGRRARLPARGVGAAVGSATAVLTKLLGAQMLKDVQTFVAALDTVFGGFRERADAHLPAAAGARDGVPRGRRARARRAARGLVLRRAAGRGADAAGRPGAQPGAHGAAAEELSAARALAAAEDLEECGRRRALAAGAAAAARRPDAAPASGSSALADAVHRGAPAGPGGRGAGAARRTCTTSPGLREIGAGLAEGLRRRPRPGRRRGLAGPGPRLGSGPAQPARRERGRGRRSAPRPRPLRSCSARAVSSRRATTSRSAGGAAAPGARARSSRPRRRTRPGCPARRPGTRCAPGTHAHRLRPVLRGPLDEQGVRVRRPACPPGRPVVCCS